MQLVNEINIKNDSATYIQFQCVIKFFNYSIYYHYGNHLLKTEFYVVRNWVLFLFFTVAQVPFSKAGRPRRSVVTDCSPSISPIFPPKENQIVSTQQDDVGRHLPYSTLAAAPGSDLDAETVFRAASRHQQWTKCWWRRYTVKIQLPETSTIFSKIHRQDTTTRYFDQL